MTQVLCLELVDNFISTLRILLVPDIAERTTNVGSPDFVINFATLFMRSGEPTEVPPNFITFIILYIFNFQFSIINFHFEQFPVLAFIYYTRELFQHTPVMS